MPACPGVGNCARKATMRPTHPAAPPRNRLSHLRRAQPMNTPPSSDPASTEGGASPRPLERAFGRMDWQPPEWPGQAFAWIQAHVRSLLIGLAVVVAIALLYGWVTRPRPPEPGALSISVSTP